jgi:hypothetical protein
MESITYLCGKKWAEITREERVFCAHPYAKVINDRRTLLAG